MASRLEIPNLRIGTSSWSAAGWVGPFYPARTRPAEFLPFYSRQFDTVEVDSTYYGVPSKWTVSNWYARTPPGFVFAAKFPQAITHEKVLIGCEGETAEFIAVMDLLREKLGPQFLRRGTIVYLYVNNHYVGFAPGSIELFHDTWARTSERDKVATG